MVQHVRARNDDGFTLVELLIALVIMPLVVGGVTMMLLGVFKMQNGVTNRLTGSTDAELLSASLIRDGQGASFVTTSTTHACGSLGTQILGFQSLGNNTLVSYDLTPRGAYTALMREVCAGANPSTPIGEFIVSDNVSPTLAASVTCSSTVTCNYATGWMGTAGVTQITLSVNEVKTGASFAVSTTPRLWNSVSAGISANPFPFAPLTLLGTSSCPNTVLSLSGSATVSVVGGSGAIADQSTCSSSVTMSGSAKISASTLGVADPTPSAAVTKSGSATFPAPVYAAPSGDPFASLAPPVAPTATGTGSCPSVGSGTCTPGNFNSAVSISGSGTITFGSGIYVFNAPVSFSGSMAVNFGAGTYVFNQGLTVSGSGQFKLGKGIYIFSASTPTGTALKVSGSGDFTGDAGGVLLYVKSGDMDFSGSGSIALSGSPNYDGIALWEAAGDTNALTLTGSSCITASYGGIYAPSATVVPSGSSVAQASFVVVEGVDFSGSSALQVG